MWFRKDFFEVLRNFYFFYYPHLWIIKMATQNNWGRHTFFMCVLFLMAAAAIAMSAIVLHRMLNDDDSDDSPTSAGTGRPVSGAEVGNPPTTPTRSTPLPDSRQGAVVDCLPRNLREPRQDVTRGECERRQWVYKYLVVYWGAPVESLLYRHLTVFTDLIWNIYVNQVNNILFHTPVHVLKSAKKNTSLLCIVKWGFVWHYKDT